MTWITLSLLSAFLLGLYDVSKKTAVDNNAVAPVLLLNVLTGAVCCLPFLMFSYWASDAPDSWYHDSIWFVSPLSVTQHFLVLIKSVLVGVSWTLSFIALQHLPISIASPIRATSPLWTIMTAVLFMGERPQWIQWLGVLIVVAAFFAFSRIGKSEGIRFAKDRNVGLLVIATVLGSCSALYDKFLLQNASITPSSLQVWFAIYLIPVMVPWFVWWFRYERQSQPFQWRWSIPLIALFLLAADFAYFTAISDPRALISIISPLRRASIIIAFLAGILWMGEKNWRSKLICIVILLFGVCLMSVGG